MWDSVRRLLGLNTADSRPSPPRSTPPVEPDADEITVPEMSVDELQAALSQGANVLVLDVREQYEWDQVHLPAGAGWPVLHIAMNAVPTHLDDLPRERTIAVLCAHGNRSFGVTHYLLEQGFEARNVTGGITRWTMRGGPVERR